MKKYVLTGAPGVGKTTLIDMFARQGHTVIPEGARMVIEQEQRAGSDFLPWKEFEAFEQKVLEMQVLLEKDIEADAVFLDRGVIDPYAFYVVRNLLPPENIAQLVLTHVYDKVFILEPLDSYENNHYRTETVDEARALHNAILDAYHLFGYEPISVPPLRPDERADFILGRI